MSAIISAKKQRLASAEANLGSLNPCIRCIPYYATGYGRSDFEECKFPDLTIPLLAKTAEGPDGTDLAYYSCNRCENSGQRCFEVNGDKYKSAKSKLGKAIEASKAAPQDVAARKAVRDIAMELATAIDAYGKPHASHFEAHTGTNEGGQSGVEFTKRTRGARKSNPGGNVGIAVMQKRVAAEMAGGDQSEPERPAKKASAVGSTPSKVLENQVRDLKTRVRAEADKKEAWKSKFAFLWAKANKTTKAAFDKQFKTHDGQ